MGSDPARTELTISDCPEVSGQHVLVHVEDDHVYVSDLRSTNGTRIHGRPSRRGAIRPGELLAMAGYDVVVLSTQMFRYLDELTLYVGRTEHLHQLLTLSPMQHLILIGAHHTPLEEIARAAHHAVASDASPLVCAPAQHGSHAEQRVLADAINGRIFIDGRGTARRSAAPTFSTELLNTLRDPQQLTAVTVGLLRPADIALRLLEHKAFVFKVPTISDRIKNGGLDDLIDAVSVRWEVPFRAPHWSKALRDRLGNYSWKRDHTQFTAVVVAVGRMWAGLPEYKAVEGLGATQTVKDWLTGLDLGWASARAERPR